MHSLGQLAQFVAVPLIIGWGDDFWTFFREAVSLYRPICTDAAKVHLLWQLSSSSMVQCCCPCCKQDCWKTPISALAATQHNPTPWPPAPAQSVSAEEPGSCLGAHQGWIGGSFQRQGNNRCLFLPGLTRLGRLQRCLRGVKGGTEGAHPWRLAPGCARDRLTQSRGSFHAGCPGNGSSLAPHATAVSLALCVYSHAGMLPKMEGQCFPAWISLLGTDFLPRKINGTAWARRI